MWAHVCHIVSMEDNSKFWSLPSILFETESLCGFSTEYSRLAGLETLPSSPPIFPRECWDYRHLSWASGFYTGLGHSNSVPHALFCAFPTGPSPHPMDSSPDGAIVRWHPQEGAESGRWSLVKGIRALGRWDSLSKGICLIKSKASQMWWRTPLTPTLRRQRSALST